MPRVTFSNDVSKVDGHAITIEEQRQGDSHSSHVSNPFLGRTITADSSDLGTKAATNEALIIGTHGTIDQEINNTRKVENLVVKMGILKCGHRYRVSVPLPCLDAIDAEHVMNNQTNQSSLQHQTDHSRARVVRVHNDDLRGEIANDGRHMNAILSARQRGPYMGRLLIEMHSNNNLAKNGPIAAVSNNETTQYISIQIEASVMGKGMGTPQLRNGVLCLGKLVGYDSDEETEWQGFD